MTKILNEKMLTKVDFSKGVIELTEWEAKIYQQGKADGIEEYRQALHIQHSQNKVLAIKCAKGNQDTELALTNLDLEEIDNIAEQLKEQI